MCQLVAESRATSKPYSVTVTACQASGSKQCRKQRGMATVAPLWLRKRSGAALHDAKTAPRRIRFHKLCTSRPETYNLKLRWPAGCQLLLGPAYMWQGPQIGLRTARKSTGRPGACAEPSWCLRSVGVSGAARETESWLRKATRGWSRKRRQNQGAEAARCTVLVAETRLWQPRRRCMSMVLRPLGTQQG